MQVKSFYWKVFEEEGKNVATKFLELMVEWDGRKDVYNAFYNEDVLQMKLKEAQEF